MKKMELTFHAGDEYVPSFEPDSLIILTYIRLGGCVVAYNPTCYPWKSPTRRFPVLVDGGKHVTGVDEIIHHLKSKGCDIDHNLTDEEKAECLSYTYLIREKLLPGLLYLRWMEDTNCVDFVRYWYSRQLMFPLTLFLPPLFHKQVIHRLSTSANRISAVTPEKNQVLTEAMLCIDSLGQCLGEKQYFLGDRFSSLDAFAFSSLCLILQQPLPGDNSLWKHLSTHNNLIEYSDHMRCNFFPELSHAPVPVAPSVALPKTLWDTLKDPFTRTILGIGALVFVIQYFRYSRSGSKQIAISNTTTADEDIDLQSTSFSS